MLQTVFPGTADEHREIPGKYARKFYFVKALDRPIVPWDNPFMQTNVVANVAAEVRKGQPYTASKFLTALPVDEMESTMVTLSTWLQRDDYLQLQDTLDRALDSMIERSAASEDRAFAE